MLRRYVYPCLLIMAVSYVTAGIAYIGAGSGDFRALCAFQSVIRLSQQPPQNDEAVKQHNKAASKEVQVAAASTLYADVAKKLNVNVRTLRQATAVGPIGQQLATFGVRATGSDPKKMVQYANATCDAFVVQIQKQRAAELESDRKTIQKRIDAAEAEIRRLVKIPKAKRTSADTAALISQQAILKANVQQLANALSLPPDDISVLTHAQAARKEVTRSLSKNVLIALIAGLLACFLLILIGEIVAENRRRTQAQSPDEPV